MKARTCTRRHSCGRQRFLDNRAAFQGVGELTEYQKCNLANFIVWDPEGDLDEVTGVHQPTLEFFSDSRDECEAFIVGGAQRCYITENGTCRLCDLYDRRQAGIVAGRLRPFYLVVEGISRHYGGPEEGGWWYNVTSILEVRRAFTFLQGLKHARELKEEHPQPRFNRYSAANHGEQDTYIQLCYGEDDPRWPQETKERPRYE